MIAVLTGGKYSERDVSLMTARTVIASLERLGWEYLMIDLLNDDWLQRLKEHKISSVLIAAHGTFAEDGQLQNLLEQNNYKFTGSSTKVAARCFDKKATKDIVEKLNIAVPKSLTHQAALKHLPVTVKPNRGGSSYGVSIIHLNNELSEAIKQAQKYDDEVMIEEYISGRELTCGVIDVLGEVQALPVVEISPKNEYFDYKSKYTEGGAVEICPAPLDKKVTVEIQEASKRIFFNLGIGQYARIDWILGDDNEPYFIEINTIPGMTPTSLINKELDSAGIKLDYFIQKLIETL